MLHILTRCTRTHNLQEIMLSLQQIPRDYTWHLIFDTSHLKDIDADLLTLLQTSPVKFYFLAGMVGDFGHGLINQVLDQITDGWVYILDDDNLFHPALAAFTTQLATPRGYFFQQWVGGLDFTGLDIRVPIPDKIEVGQIDMAQMLVHRSLIQDFHLNRFQYVADGNWIAEIYQAQPENFIFLDQLMCYYNKLQQKSMPISLPRILVYGVEEIDLNSAQPVEYEDSSLRLLVKKTDVDFEQDLQKFKPDSIVTIGSNFEQFTHLSQSGFEERRKWLHFNEVEGRIGPVSYTCAMHSILSGRNLPNEPLVSFFTPFFNTGEKIRRTYESVANQTYKNWEWVLVNDSTDHGKTLKIVEEIAALDHRIKVYDFREKSGGVIGEAKYRAATLAKGHYLMELDHDDYLLPRAAELMVQAFQAHPDAKFVYSDAAEVDENHCCLTYGPGFALGYGAYRDEIYNGRLYQVAISPPINPLTIRHIVGVPNHFRAWDRNFYFSILGHNRDLTIADDYELIIRTFLRTRMVYIPKMCYLQFYHNSPGLNNTQNSSRGDIQRRVRTIMEYYNINIRNRFLELGVTDWAYDYNPQYPLSAPCQTGSEVNYVYVEKVEDGLVLPYLL